MAVKREENPAGSSDNLRGDVLRVLGVLKVAMVEQIQQISAPHLSYRHTDKPTPSKRKQARTASHTGALSDLRKHGLAENGGQIPGGDGRRQFSGVPGRDGRHQGAGQDRPPLRRSAPRSSRRSVRPATPPVRSGTRPGR